MKSIHVALWKIRSMTHRREVVLSVNTVVIRIPLFPVYDKDPSLPKHGPVFEHAQDEKSHGISLSKDMHVANMWSIFPPVAKVAFLVSGASDCHQPPRGLPALETYTVVTH